MENPTNSKIIHSGKEIAKNTLFNILGYVVPMIFAIIFIPPLIKGLGTERFGILTLAWMIIGYFSLFDFSIGRALTKVIAERLGTNEAETIPTIFWTLLLVMLVVSLIVTIILFFLVPVLVYKFFNISEAFQNESLYTFYALAISVPIVILTAGIRGTLEAYHKFGIINIIRIILGMLTFLGPLVCLFIVNSLFWIVVTLIILRIFALSFYFIICLRANPNFKTKIKFDTSIIKPILKLSGWMTVSNVVGPLITYLDRFLIGALISATAITYYATPYEVITKLLLIPGALIGVLFPAFSANYQINPEFTVKLLLRGIKYVFLILFPIILLIATFAFQGMDLWLGKIFAEKSSLILQLFTIGILFNGISYVPFTFLQGIGKPDITAKVHLVELPIYLVAMWIAINQLGIIGAALVWLIRTFIDAIVLLLFAKKITLTHIKFNTNYLMMLVISVVSFVPILISNVNLKIVLATFIVITFVFITWKFVLIKEEKKFLLSHIKIFSI